MILGIAIFVLDTRSEERELLFARSTQRNVQEQEKIVMKSFAFLYPDCLRIPLSKKSSQTLLVVLAHDMLAVYSDPCKSLEQSQLTRSYIGAKSVSTLAPSNMTAHIIDRVSDEPKVGRECTPESSARTISTSRLEELRDLRDLPGRRLHQP